MAHLLKISRSQAHAEIAHVMREKTMGDNVDVSLSKGNIYYCRSGHPFSGQNGVPLSTQYEERLKEVKVQARSDVNTLASWVVTLPPDIDVKNKKEVDQFFSTTVNFVSRRYPKSFIGAGIHFDEPGSRPHAHILMVPVVKEIKAEKVRDPESGKLKKTGKKVATGRYKVSAKELFTKKDLQSFHQDLSAVLIKDLGREVAVLRDSITMKEGGNRTISQLKLDTARRRVEEEYRKMGEKMKEAQDKVVLAEKKAKLAQLNADTVREHLEKELQRTKEVQNQAAAAEKAAVKAREEADIAKKAHEKAERELKDRLMQVDRIRVQINEKIKKIDEESEKNKIDSEKIKDNMEKSRKIMEDAQRKADKLIDDANVEIEQARIQKRPARRVSVRRNQNHDHDRGMSR